jgi:hypothetical protein
MDVKYYLLNLFLTITRWIFKEFYAFYFFNKKGRIRLASGWRLQWLALQQKNPIWNKNRKIYSQQIF